MPYSVDFPEEFPNSNESLLPAETLVPNLESLLVCTYSYTRAKNVNWIYKFLTSRLREFRLLSVTGLEEGVRDPQLDLETYIGLLDKISTICPQIEVLHAHGAEDRQFPRKKHKNRPPETQPPMDVWDRSTALGRKHVPSLFPGLLQDLGELRHLEALFLHIDQDQSHSRDNEPIVLSDNSFVSLQHLTLSGSHPSALVHSPRSIFPNLRTATVHMRSFAGSNDWSRGIGLFSSFVDPELGQNSPDFVHLSIKPLKRGNNITLNWLPPGIFKHTSLKYLETSNVRLNFRSLIGWESFSAVVPHLEELTLWSQEIGMLMLSFIARALPYLRLLVLDALWPDSSVPGAAHFSGSLPVMTPIKIKCRIGRPSGYASGWSKKLVSKTAGYVFSTSQNSENKKLHN
ncbi:hypothetical protein FRC09_011884 [Ceratobasidium sp. 395]|nr:hypothetical protein FRC09_011884 [Ceratobasidium sp. 395]